MKIAYLINQYPKVSHSFIRREIQTLESLGVEVTRFAVRSCAEELVDEADKAELQVTHVILSQRYGVLIMSFLKILVMRPFQFLKALNLTIQVGWGSDRGLLLHLAYLVEACYLYFCFSNRNISHSHAHFGTNATTVLMLCHILGSSTYSFTVHGPEEFDKPLGIALTEKIQRAKFVIAISSFTRSQLYRWCSRQNWQKIHLIRCGLETDFLQHNFIPVDDTAQFICVGRLCEQKGQLLLLKAVKRLAEKGIYFKLILVGDGPLRPEIEEFIQQYQLEDYVQISGWASNQFVKQLMLESRFLVLPSFAEGLPVVLMEAQALGRAVISTTIAGIPELIVHRESGWLLPPGSIDDLEEILQLALRTECKNLDAMGKVGNQKVSVSHNAKIEAQKLCQIFQANFA